MVIVVTCGCSKDCVLEKSAKSLLLSFWEKSASGWTTNVKLPSSSDVMLTLESWTVNFKISELFVEAEPAWSCNELLLSLCSIFSIIDWLQLITVGEPQFGSDELRLPPSGSNKEDSRLLSGKVDWG